jgi:hypothetical protein
VRKGIYKNPTSKYGEMRSTYGKQRLHKLAHDATEEEAHKESEHEWTMTPEPYSSVFPMGRTRPSLRTRQVEVCTSGNLLFYVNYKVKDSCRNPQAEKV